MTGRRSWTRSHSARGVRHEPSRWQHSAAVEVAAASIKRPHHRREGQPAPHAHAEQPITGAPRGTTVPSLWRSDRARPVRRLLPAQPRKGRRSVVNGAPPTFPRFARVTETASVARGLRRFSSTEKSGQTPPRSHRRQPGTPPNQRMAHSFLSTASAAKTPPSSDSALTFFPRDKVAQDPAPRSPCVRAGTSGIFGRRAPRSGPIRVWDFSDPPPPTGGRNAEGGVLQVRRVSRKSTARPVDPAPQVW